MIRFVMVLGAFAFIVAIEPALAVPALMVWFGAYLMGRASRDDPPDVRFTVEEVDLEVRHIPELDPITVASFTIARKPRTR